jgi:hypothetical protein
VVASECHIVEVLSGPAGFELFLLPSVFRGGPVCFGEGDCYFVGWLATLEREGKF